MIQLDSDENIILEVRRHPIYIIFRIVALLSVDILILLSLYFLGYGAEKIVFFGDPLMLFIFISGLVVLMAVISFFVFWTKYYFDYWVVTNKRIIDIEQIDFFHQNIAEITLDKVQDITVDVSGFLATMFGFGDISIQSAGESREFIIKTAKNAQEVRDKISELQG